MSDQILTEQNFSILIKGFHTQDEVEEFINWYMMRGEQNIWDYLDVSIENGKQVRESLNGDPKKTYPITFENNCAILYIEE